MSNFDSISAETLQQQLSNNERPVLVHTFNGGAYFAKRIPSLINIPTSHIGRIEEPVPDKEQPMVVYCTDADCDASLKAARPVGTRNGNSCNRCFKGTDY